MSDTAITNTIYAEHTEDPSTWASPRPAFDLEKFNKELERRGGSIGSVPRFRCRWAGEHDEYILEEVDAHIGYTYQQDGQTHFVSAADVDFEFPDGAVVNPEFEHTNYFTPRFVIEEYREPFYHKVWFIETVKRTGGEFGRVDLLSKYREPSEVDLKMAEHLSYLRRTLTDEQIAEGLAQRKAVSIAQAQAEKDEYRAELAEDFSKALIDGMPNAKKFGFNPNLKFNILDFSKRKIKEHDEKL